MKNSLVIVGLSLVLGMSSCKDKESPKSVANDLCSCVMSSGFNSIKGGGGSFDEGYEGLPECGKDLSDRLQNVMAELDKDGKAAFTREVLKELLDTKCIDFAIAQMGEDQFLETVLNWLEAGR